MKTKADLEARIVELTRQVNVLHAKNIVFTPLLNEAQEAIDVLAQDVADEFPRRSENATDLAMRIRTALA
jgi:hypothetical protein